jgi:hypothetical protein
MGFQAIQPLTAQEESAQQKADDENWHGVKNPLVLTRGSFVLLRYPARLLPGETTPKALVLFGSGCSGWSDFERQVSHRFQLYGCEVLGVDFALYSKSDYDLETLQQDYGKIVAFGLAPYAGKKPPVILGGWSTGAEEAVAVAGGPHPPAGVAGLFLISPGSEGGYGPYATSLFSFNAPAGKLFKLADFGPRLKNLRVVQWHAEFDVLDSRDWLSSLKVPHREFDFPNAIHDFGGPCDQFLDQLNGSFAWILNEPAPAENGSPPAPSTPSIQ